MSDPEEDRIAISPAMRAAGADAFFYDDRFDGIEDSLELVFKAMEAVRRREEGSTRASSGNGVVAHPRPRAD